MLAESWPPTSCLYENNLWREETKKYSRCFYPGPHLSQWVVHGLWPTSWDSNKIVSECTDKVAYDFKSINPKVKKNLANKWYTSNLRVTNDALWRHEFITHGTCTYNLGIGEDMNEFFKKTMELLDWNNAGEILAEENIVPGGNYQLLNITNALEKHLQVYVRIKCQVSMVGK